MSLEVLIAISIPRMNTREEPTMRTLRVRRTQARRRGVVLALPALLATAALGLTACSPSNASSPGSSPYGNPAPTKSKSSAPASSGTALAVRSISLGTILTDGRGFTVYAFDADKGTKSACSGACATAWPPVTATGTTPHVGTGVTQSLVGEATRADGTKQLTYAGRPLYLYAGDSAPGSANGDGSTAFGARWDALKASGKDATGGS
jgi:predicted lipoprotein with Yx(FWY)xxD motif